MLEEGGEYVVYGALPDDGTIAEEKGSMGSSSIAKPISEITVPLQEMAQREPGIRALS